MPQSKQPSAPATTPQDNAGFALPAPNSGNNTQPITVPASDIAPSTPAATTNNNVPTPLSTNTLQDPNLLTVTNTSNRDLLIGGFILLILTIAFFFTKNAYANMLVSKRIPPNRANAAGWWMFIFLMNIAVGTALLLAKSINLGLVVYINPLIMWAMAFIGIFSLVLLIISSRK